jgi:DNA polymerase-3 subunit delta
VPTLTPDACLAQIAGGAIAPVYLLTGPDAGQKSAVVAALTDTLEEDLRAFNLDRLHAGESKAELRKQFWGILDLARTLPMMAPRRLVVVMGAEKMLGALREAEGGAAELEALEAYLTNPSPHATVVFVTGAAADRRARAVSLIEKSAVVVDCDPLEDASDAGAWVRAEAAREGIRIEPAAVRLLAGLAGNDIGRLRAEFERALLFASGDGIITEAAVQEVAGAPTSRDPWAMTNALERRQTGDALRELALKLDGGEFPVMILGQLAWYVRTKHPPQSVRVALDAVFRTDVALKTSRGEPRVLLERLIVELCR